MIVTLCMLDVSGQPTGRRFDFDSADRLLLGRDRSAHCSLPNDPAISRHHLLLEILPPEAKVKDLGSTNGFHVNDVHYGGKVGKRETNGTVPIVGLEHGDRLRVGKTILEFTVDPPPTFSNTTLIPVTTAADAMLAKAGAVGLADVSLRFDHFCDRCGKLISADSAVVQNGRTRCMACRLIDADEKPPAAMGFAQLVQAHARANGEPPAIPGYTFSGLLGQGGMGVVFGGVRAADNLSVAVKVMPAELSSRQGADVIFRREISILRALSHPHIVSFFDAGSLNDDIYLVMERLDGGSVARRIKRGGPVPPAVAIRWLKQLTGALAAAHKSHFVHRDIKPSNILLDAKDDKANVKLSDFGLSKSLLAAGLSGFTVTGQAAGTPSCMPPEQLTDFKRVTPAADVFSLGATFYEMLTKHSPYNFTKEKDFAATVLDFDMTPLEKRCLGLPKAIYTFVETCLDRDPDRRFPDGQAMLAALPR